MIDIVGNPIPLIAFERGKLYSTDSERRVIAPDYMLVFRNIVRHQVLGDNHGDIVFPERIQHTLRVMVAVRMGQNS